MSRLRQLPPATTSLAGIARQNLFNVRDYGATGNGTSDDTAAIQACINASAFGSRVYFPAGVYLVSSVISLKKSRYYFGDDRETTTIKMANGANLDAVLASETWLSTSSLSSDNPVHLTHIGVNGNKANQTGGSGHGIALISFWNSLNNLEIQQCRGDGLHLTSQRQDGTEITGSSVECHVTRVDARFCDGYGIIARDPTPSAQSITDGWIRDCIVQTPGEGGIRIESGEGWVVDGCHVYSCAKTGINIGRADNTRVSNNYIESWGYSTTPATYSAIVLGDGNGTFIGGVRPSTVTGNTCFYASGAVSGTVIFGIRCTVSSGIEAHLCITGNGVYGTLGFFTGLSVGVQDNTASAVVTDAGNNLEGWATKRAFASTVTVYGDSVDATTTDIGSVLIDQAPGSGHPIAVTTPRIGAASGIASLDANSHVQQQSVYDSTEAQTNDALAAGSTVVGNLNRIRYQLGQLVGGAWTAAVQMIPLAQKATASGVCDLDSGTHVPLSRLNALTTSQLSATAGIVAGQVASVNPSVLTGTGTVPLAGLTGITTTQLSATAGIVAGQITGVNPSALTGSGTVPAAGLPVATTTVKGTVIVPTSGNLGVDGSGNITLGTHASTHEPGGSDDLYPMGGHAIPNALETFPRALSGINTATMTSGIVLLSMFTAISNLTAHNITFITGNATPSGASLCRFGLYTVDGSGNSTLVAATASDSTLLAVANTAYTKALSLAGDLSTAQSSYALTRGSRYALAAIWVGSGTAPVCLRINGNATAFGIAPVVTGQRSGQTDLTLSNTTSNAPAGASILYAYLT